MAAGFHALDSRARAAADPTGPQPSSILARPAVSQASADHCACDECQAGQQCQGHDEKKSQIARRASAALASEAGVPAALAVAGRGGGRPLDPRIRAEMESKLGGDFSSVRVHTGEAAARSAAGIQAQAYTVGHEVVFGSGAYAPESPEGWRTLAHELVHVQQQRHGPAAGGGSVAPADGAHERQAEAVAAAAQAGRPPPAFIPAGHGIHRLPQGAEEPGTSASIGMSVSISGLAFDVPDTVTFRPGRKSPQLMAVALQRLLGGQYRPGLENEVIAELRKRGFERFGGFRDDRSAKAGEPMGRITFGIQATLFLIDFLKAKKLEVQLTPQQEELLTLGFASRNLWADFVSTLREYDVPLPAWYTRDIFEREIAQQGVLLRGYADQLAKVAKAKADSESDRLARVEIVNKVIDALYQPAMVLEAIRLDVSLAANKDSQDAYGSLWELPPAKKGETPKVTKPPVKVRNAGTVVLFLGYMRTQPQLTRYAETSPEDRVELLKRFGRFQAQLVFTGTVKQGDEEIRDRPATANYPAFPSTLTPVPAVSPPLFDAALGTDHRFSMEVQFPSVYEALGRYGFSWERVRIPDDKIGEPVDVTKLKGEEITRSEVAAVRFSRDTAYAKADISRVIDTMKSDIGSPGVGALELVGANAILRYIGTGIRLGLEILTMPWNQKLVVFPDPGLYMVRAAMSQLLEGSEEVVRAPSVAYYPVLARDPDEMAAAGVKSTLTAREKARQRMSELQSKLSQPGLDPAETKQLTQELDALRQSFAPLGERLERRRSDLADLAKSIEAGKTEGDLEAVSKKEEDLEKSIALRAKRKIGDAESLEARFVSDLGQTVSLDIEVVDRPATKGGAFKVYVSDVTTPKSGDETGTGPTRDDAIANAVKDLLESINGYGRGRVAVALSGGVRTIRIEASLGNLLTESLENVTTVLSVALVAAAPFTGGASLSLLIPLGLVGAIPSAYRVVQRVEAGTFDLSLESALEIANIAGSVIGLGRIGASSLRMMRLGKAMLIVGFGVDAANGLLMSAQFMQQIDALYKLPPGERSAALLMLIGQTMMTAGVTAGGALAEHAQQIHAEGQGGKLGGLHDEVPATTREASAAGESRATGEPPVAGEPPAAKPAGPAADIMEKARVDTEMGRLGKMDADSEARLRGDEPLREALVEQPLAAEVLRKCASPCFPPEVTPEQVAQLDRLLSRLDQTGGGYDKAALKEYLYERRTKLGDAIKQIEGVTDGASLNAYLEYFKRGGKITELPPQGDPRLLLEQRDRAHDYGVSGGQAQAAAENLHSAGFTNPFERYGRYGQGFDDIRQKGPSIDLGEVYVVEYKGGDAVLSKGQMELDWIIGNIRRLYNEGGPAGQQWARTLAKALREGRLKGVAYSTPVLHGQPQPTVTIKAWAYQSVNLKLP